jgi:hypothetical protein
MPIPNLSSHNYVAAKMKESLSIDPFEQIRVSIPERCDHTTTICPTKECVESWSIDWELFFTRTIAGRDRFAQFK